MTQSFGFWRIALSKLVAVFIFYNDIASNSKLQGKRGALAGVNSAGHQHQGYITSSTNFCTLPSGAGVNTHCVL